MFLICVKLKLYLHLYKLYNNINATSKNEREREGERTMMEEKRELIGRKTFLRRGIARELSIGTSNSKTPIIYIHSIELLKYCPTGLTASSPSSLGYTIFILLLLEPQTQSFADMRAETAIYIIWLEVEVVACENKGIDKRKRQEGYLHWLWLWLRSPILTALVLFTRFKIICWIAGTVEEQ